MRGIALAIACCFVAGHASAARPERWPRPKEQLDSVPDLSRYEILTISEIEAGPRIRKAAQVELAETFDDVVFEVLSEKEGLELEIRRGEPLGQANELVLTGTVVKLKRGSRGARYLVGPLARSRLIADLELADGASDEPVTTGRIDKLWAWPGLAGLTRGPKNLLMRASRDLADYLEQAGVVSVPVTDDSGP